MRPFLEKLITESPGRFDLSIAIINYIHAKRIAELGVAEGDYARAVLQNCHQIESYYMIDPWRQLENWNKPYNKAEDIFKESYKRTLQQTEFASEKRRILKGKTIEVIQQIEPESLDFAYVDGDHSLRGITIDLLNIWPKLIEEGVIVGDDFYDSIWQHNISYEPTLVFPFAIYFAEAMDVKIFALPHGQFLIHKAIKGFEFINLSNLGFKKMDIRSQVINSRKAYVKYFIDKIRGNK